jgi:hypothetical protein
MYQLTQLESQKKKKNSKITIIIKAQYYISTVAITRARLKFFTDSP